MQLAGRPLVDDSMLINYLSNRYEVRSHPLTDPAAWGTNSDVNRVIKKYS